MHFSSSFLWINFNISATDLCAMPKPSPLNNTYEIHMTYPENSFFNQERAIHICINYSNNLFLFWGLFFFFTNNFSYILEDIYSTYGLNIKKRIQLKWRTCFNMHYVNKITLHVLFAQEWKNMFLEYTSNWRLNFHKVTEWDSAAETQVSNAILGNRFQKKTSMYHIQALNVKIHYKLGST